MTSKERARIAMRGGTPDRVPVLPQICPPHAVRAAGLPFKETVADILRRPREYDLLVAQCAQRYGVDGFRVWVGRPPRTVEWAGDCAYEVDPQSGERVGEVDFMGGGGVVRLKAKQRLLADRDIDAIAVTPADVLLRSDALAPTRRAVAHCGADLFVVGVPPMFTVETLMFTEGMEQALLDMIERPDFVKRWTARMLESSIQHALAMVRAGVDALYIGETFGGFMSPEQFAELCLPYFQRFVEQLRPYGPLIYLHMCGRVTHLLDGIAETGVDCLEPLDIVGGTSAADVKRRLGGRMALMGGVNTVLLSRGSLEEVRADCARCLRDAAGGGGYLLAACDMLPTETAPEKVRAMIQCAETLGRYAPWV